MPDGYTIKHDAELERDYGKWVLVRRSLGIRSFGINIVELAHGEAIPEHHELDRGQEEIFFVIEGAPTITIDNADHALEAGAFVRLDARADAHRSQRRRRRRARHDRVRADRQRLRAHGLGVAPRRRLHPPM